MRFVWFTSPTEKPTGVEISGAHEGQKYHEKPAEHEKDLKAFFDAQDEAKLSEAQKKEKKEFIANLEKWDQSGDTEALRTAGRSEKQDSDNYLSKHALLSSAFLERAKSDKIRFKVNFGTNELATWKVGAGDLLPANVHEIKVYKPGGEVLEGVRSIHPTTKRIGYYVKSAFEQGQFEYIPVFSGDEIEIVKTYDVPKTGDANTLYEHGKIYQNGAAKDTASMGKEIMYDGQSRLVHPTYESAREAQQEERRQSVVSQTRTQMGYTIETKGNKRFVVLDGKRYEIFNTPDFQREFGDNWGVASRWILRKDPVTGGELAFLGCRIPDGFNAAILPYLKEAEERIKAAGIDYKVRNATATAWRMIRGGNTPSNHSWGVAIDMNTDVHSLGSKKTDMPPEFVAIMKSLGFVWGGDWRGRPDPMHFEFRIDPWASTDLLRTGNSRKYMDALADISDSARQKLAAGKERPPQQAQTPSAPAAARTQTETAPGKTAGHSNSPETVKTERGGDLQKLGGSIERATGRWVAFIKASCERYGIADYVPLIQSIMFMESGGNPNAVSKRNSNGSVDQGLMQLNSGYYRGAKYMDPATNIDAAVRGVSALIKRYNGNLIDVLAAYNCGHAEGEQGRGLPGTTKRIYIPRVLKHLAALGMTNLPEHGNYSETRYA
jgi:hypothetical protein